ncbi:MAG TPA: OsmC family protein [Terriglobia bacterium]|nr:OsmC family protein [Terriglobia bacterium]
MVKGQIGLQTIEGSGKRFIGVSGSGHRITFDDAQGDAGPRPTEAALLALGACTAFDVISILRKKRQIVRKYQVELEAQQHEEPPTYFTAVTVKHRLWGEIDPEAVKRAIHLSETKYCSVGAMISKTATIHTIFEIIPGSAGEEPDEAKS